MEKYAREYEDYQKKTSTYTRENTKNVVTIIINLIPNTTPYEGITYECALLPMKYRIKPKRLLYLKKIISTKENQLIKQVYKE